MEGGYMPSAHRKKLAQQVRKTHFSFGHSAKPVSTTHNAFYKTHTSFQKPSELSTIKASLSPKIQIGEKTCLSKFSEFSWEFRRSSVEPEQSVNLDMLKTNFVIGSHPVSYLSTSSKAQDEIQNYTKSNPAQPKMDSNELRMHHFELGTGPSSQISVMKSEFKGYPGERATGKKVKITDSKVIIGGDPKQLTSISQQDYLDKERIPNGKIDKSDMMNAHFSIGQETPLKKTETASAFSPKEGGPQKFNEETRNNLRQHHFTLGKQTGPYVSVNSTSFSPRAQTRPEFAKEVRTRSNFSFGEEGRWNTTYERNSPKSFKVRKPDNLGIYKGTSNVVFGTASHQKTTTEKTGLKGEIGVPGRLDPKYENYLRGHHYDMGGDKVNYNSVYRTYGKEEGRPSEADPKVYEKMFETHWTVGNDPNNFVSLQKKDYREGRAHSEKPSKKLQEHHWSIGTNDKTARSTYKGSYNWVQPVADNSYSFKIGD